MSTLKRKRPKRPLLLKEEKLACVGWKQNAEVDYSENTWEEEADLPGLRQSIIAYMDDMFTTCWACVSWSYHR